MISAINRTYSLVRRNRRLRQWPDGFQPTVASGIDVGAIDIRRALRGLGEKQRQVLEMTLEGLSAKEIAGELGMTLDAVYTAASRGRQALRDKVGCNQGKNTAV